MLPHTAIIANPCGRSLTRKGDDATDTELSGLTDRLIHPVSCGYPLNQRQVRHGLCKELLDQQAFNDHLSSAGRSGEFKLERMSWPIDKDQVFSDLHPESSQMPHDVFVEL